jgi:hypothetical protein
MNTADEFRKNAAECRALADGTSNPQEKAQWLKLADEWLRMAQSAHSRPDAFDAK